MKYFLFLTVILSISACASSPVKIATKDTDKIKAIPTQVYDEDVSRAAKFGYQEGVRQGAAAARKMNGPYVWRPYKVERIRVPARVVNGIMYPGHEEEVIVRPSSIDREYGDSFNE